MIGIRLIRIMFPIVLSETPMNLAICLRLSRPGGVDELSLLGIVSCIALLG